MKKAYLILLCHLFTIHWYKYNWINSIIRIRFEIFLHICCIAAELLNAHTHTVWSIHSEWSLSTCEDIQLNFVGTRMRFESCEHIAESFINRRTEIWCEWVSGMSLMIQLKYQISQSIWKHWLCVYSTIGTYIYAHLLFHWCCSLAYANTYIYIEHFLYT